MCTGDAWLYMLRNVQWYMLQRKRAPKKAQVDWHLIDQYHCRLFIKVGKKCSKIISNHRDWTIWSIYIATAPQLTFGSLTRCLLMLSLSVLSQPTWNFYTTTKCYSRDINIWVFLSCLIVICLFAKIRLFCVMACRIAKL